MDRLDYIVGFDIETDNSKGFGLDPNNSSVTLAGIFVLPVEGEPVSGSSSVCGQSSHTDDPLLSEAHLLDCISSHLRVLPKVLGAYEGNMLIATWNGAVFDLPWLITRSFACKHRILLHDLLGMEADPNVHIKYAPLPGHDGGYSGSFANIRHVDSYQAWGDWAYAQQEANGDDVKVTSLKPLARYVGWNPIVEDAGQLHTLTTSAASKYVLSDAAMAAGLAKLALDLDVDLISGGKVPVHTSLDRVRELASSESLCVALGESLPKSDDEPDTPEGESPMLGGDRHAQTSATKEPT